MTVKEAAKHMGKTEQFVRIGLQRGVFPWGYAVKIDKHYSYYINTGKFFAEEGIDLKAELTGEQAEILKEAYKHAGGIYERQNHQGDSGSINRNHRAVVSAIAN